MNYLPVEEALGVMNHISIRIIDRGRWVKDLWMK